MVNKLEWVSDACVFSGAWVLGSKWGFEGGQECHHSVIEGLGQGSINHF